MYICTQIHVDVAELTHPRDIGNLTWKSCLKAYFQSCLAESERLREVGTEWELGHPWSS